MYIQRILRIVMESAIHLFMFYKALAENIEDKWAI